MADIMGDKPADIMGDTMVDIMVDTMVAETTSQTFDTRRMHFCIGITSLNLASI